MAWPLIVRTRSPGCKPALSAGLSSTTSRTHPYIVGIGFHSLLRRWFNSLCPILHILDSIRRTCNLPEKQIYVRVIINVITLCVKLFISSGYFLLLDYSDYPCISACRTL